MVKLNLIEKLKVVFNIGKKSRNHGLFIASRNIVNNGKIQSKGYENNTIISDKLISTGEINIEK